MIKWSKLKSPMQQSMTLKYLVLFVGMCSVLEEKEETRNIYFFSFRENIGEYNLSDLLQAPHPISENPEPLKYTITEDVKKMQAAMQKLFLQQKEKGGIIDLEAEERKYLVVTNSATSQDEALAELSPTDYQPGKT